MYKKGFGIKQPSMFDMPWKPTKTKSYIFNIYV